MKSRGISPSRFFCHRFFADRGQISGGFRIDFEYRFRFGIDHFAENNVTTPLIRRLCNLPFFHKLTIGGRELIDCLVSQVDRGLHDLDIEVTENSVILRGRAPSYYVKQLAQEAAIRMQYRAKLVNEIVVCSSTPVGFEMVNDGLIRSISCEC